MLFARCKADLTLLRRGESRRVGRRRNRSRPHVFQGMWLPGKLGTLENETNPCPWGLLPYQGFATWWQRVIPAAQQHRMKLLPGQLSSVIG